MRITRRQWLALPTLAWGQSVHDEIRRLADEAPLAMQFKGGAAEECRAWQRTFAAKLGELLGPYRSPERWETIRERTVDLDDHRREELLLRAAGHRDLPVYLLTPRGESSGRRPGILALHGHGKFGYDAVAGIAGTAERQKDIAGSNYDYGLELVRRGYVVAAPCFTPFGRRLDDPRAYRGQDACGVTFIRMQLLGKVLMAENLRDALWSLELLGRHAQVDRERLGCVGLSYGGRMTMLTAAVEPRIRVAVISGALNVMQERITWRYGCGAQVIPGLLQYGDVPEIASLIAPRPCLWEVGRQDALMVKDRIEPALARMRRAWRAFDALDRLEVDFFDGGHRWNGVRAYPLLARVLRVAGA
ncbi:MAG: acetylxylan esterase [Acidobacteria bacterium]|nr:acetylxylan esterase [Acidobacteriota bacterium]